MRKQHLILIAALVLVAACSREETKSATDKIKEGSAEVVEGVKEGAGAAAENVAEGAKNAAEATKEAADDVHDKAVGDH